MSPAAIAQPRRDWEFVEAWGMSSGAAARVIRPRSTDELQTALEEAQSAGVSLAPRGAGCSYGDASTLSDGWVLDLTQMNKVLAFDPESGVLEAEAGLSVRGAWQNILPHGWWPYVVSGTMHPTIAGAAAMNIHGKNNYRLGAFGEGVRSFELMTPKGELVRSKITDNGDGTYTVAFTLNCTRSAGRGSKKTCPSLGARMHSSRQRACCVSSRVLRACPRQPPASTAST